MPKEAKSEWAPYWWRAWRERPPVRFFAAYRAIPAVLVSAAQFIWKRNGHSSFTEMWVAILIIVSVYLTLFTLEVVRNFVLASPANIHSQQSETIATLTKEIESLKQQKEVPDVSPQEQRRRQMVSEKMKALGPVGRKILRCIADHGKIKSMALEAEYDFNGAALNGFYQRAITGSLILYENHVVSINPELKSAIEFVLAEEREKDLKG